MAAPIFYRKALRFHSLRKVFVSVDRAAQARRPLQISSTCLFLPLTQDSREAAPHSAPSPRKLPGPGKSISETTEEPGDQSSFWLLGWQ